MYMYMYMYRYHFKVSYQSLKKCKSHSALH